MINKMEVIHPPLQRLDEKYVVEEYYNHDGNRHESERIGGNLCRVCRKDEQNSRFRHVVQDKTI